MSPRRVINLGLPKSGTTTVETALREAKFRIADWKVRRWDCKDPALVGQSIAKIFYDNFYGCGDPLRGLESFDAFTEINIINLKQRLCLWPQTDFALIDAIRRHHPDVRFIASWRPPEKIADSMMRWNNLGRVRMPNGWVPGLPPGYGTDAGQLARWIEGHYAHLRVIFGDDPAFLELDVADPEAPAKLGAHLETEILWWGKANENLNRPEGRQHDDEDENNDAELVEEK